MLAQVGKHLHVCKEANLQSLAISSILKGYGKVYLSSITAPRTAQLHY
jgi:hypothetical protein